MGRAGLKHLLLDGSGSAAVIVAFVPVIFFPPLAALADPPANSSVVQSAGDEPNEFGGLDIEQLSRVRIVTARKREERAFDIPATLTVFDRNRLRELRADSLGDLQNYIPNFFYSSPRPFATAVTMRGLGGAIGTPPGIGFYIDGAYQVDDAAFTLPLYDLERVEVLKGPQGTLYGRNSFAGAINYITRSPSNQLEADGTAEIGTGGTRKVTASIAGPLVDGTLTGRINVGLQRRNGFLNYSSGADADFDNHDAVSGRVAFVPTESFRADLNLAYVDISSGGFTYHQVTNVNDRHGRLLITSPFQYGPYAGQSQYSGVKHWRDNLKLTYTASGFDVVSISAYDYTKSFALTDLDLQPLDALNALVEFRRDALSEELRLQSKGQGPLTWLLGGYYSRGDLPSSRTTRSGLVNPAGPGTSTFFGAANVDFDGYAFFSDAEYMFNTQFSLGAGIRYDKLHKATVVSGTNSSLSASFSGVQPKITAKYLFDQQTQVHLNVAKGFREGGFNPQLAGTVYQSYPSDQLWSYELGIKHRLPNGKGQLELTGFYIDAGSYNGGATVNTPAGFRFITAPIGKVESYGAALSASYLLGQYFSLGFDSGYNVARAVELSPIAEARSAQVGQQVTNAPRWNYRVSLKMETPLRHASMYGGMLAEVKGAGPTSFPGATAPVERDPYHLLDLSAWLRWGNKYELRAFVKNVTNTVYATDYIDASVVSLFGGASSAVTYNTPRYFGLSFSLRL